MNRGNGHTVLVIDDDPAVRDFAPQALRRLGVRAVTFETGAQALELLHDFPFDLVVTEYELPGFGGEALVQALRQTYPDAPILVTSQEPLTVEELDDLLQAGMSRFVQKPFIGAELCFIVSEYLHVRV